MIQWIALLAMFPVAALAQSTPNPTRTGTSISGVPNSVLSPADILGAFATKLDVNSPAVTPLVAYLGAGQTMAQLTAGSINSAPIINAALAATGSVVLPCGSYRLDGALAAITVDGGGIVGGGKMCTRFNVNFASGSVVTIGVVGATGNGVRNTRLIGFSLISQVTHTAGAAIDVGTHYDADIRDVMVDGNWSDELVLHGGGGAITRVKDSWFGTYSGTNTSSCIRLIEYAVDTYIDQVNTNNCKTGLLIENASGIYLSNMDMYGSTLGGITIAPGSLQNVNAVFASNVLADTGAGTAWAFAGTGQITDVHLVNVWGSGSAGTSSGMSLTNAALDGLTMQNGHFHHNGAFGIQVSAGKHITIGGGTQVWNNGAASTSGGTCTSPAYDGIQVSGGATYVNVSNSMSGAGGYIRATAGLPNCQRYGMSIDSSSTGIVTVSHMDFDANFTSSMSVAGTGYVLADHNIGFTTANRGTAFIPSGATCGSVALGLSVGVPDAAVGFSFSMVANSGDSSVTHGPTSFWVQPISSGSAIVCGNVATTANVYFNWYASAYGG